MTTTATILATALGPDHTYPPPKPNQLAASVLQKLYPHPTPLSISHLTTREIALYTTVLAGQPKYQNQRQRTIPKPLLSNDLGSDFDSEPDSPNPNPNSKAKVKAKVNAQAQAQAQAAYRRRTTALISSLSPRLQNPTRGPLSTFPQSYLVSLFHTIGANAALPPAAHLCTLHSGLNAQLVADALGAVQMEAEDFLPALLRGSVAMSSALASTVRATQDFVASFVDAREFTHWFGRAPPRRWSRPVKGEGEGEGEDSCAACMLARVAADGDLLVGLRAVMLARMPDGVLDGEARSPRLEWVEGWMRTWGRLGTEMLFRSGRLGEELKVLAGRERGRGTDSVRHAEGETEEEDEDEAECGAEVRGGVRRTSSDISLADGWEPGFLEQLEQADGMWSPYFTLAPARASSVLLPLSLPQDATAVSSSTYSPQNSPSVILSFPFSFPRESPVVSSSIYSPRNSLSPPPLEKAFRASAAPTASTASRADKPSRQYESEYALRFSSQIHKPQHPIPIAIPTPIQISTRSPLRDSETQSQSQSQPPPRPPPARPLPALPSALPILPALRAALSAGTLG